MSKEPKVYTAKADTGRDYITFQFTSAHRANSKANKDDARRAYCRKHGHAPQIISTTRDEYSGGPLY